MKLIMLVDVLADKPGAGKTVENGIIELLIGIRAGDSSFLEKFRSPLIQILGEGANVEEYDLWEAVHKPLSAKDADAALSHRVDSRHDYWVAELGRFNLCMNHSFRVFGTEENIIFVSELID